MGFGSGSCSFSKGNRSVNIAPISIINQHLNYGKKCVYLLISTVKSGQSDMHWENNLCQRK